MLRALLAGLTAIALLCSASLALITWATREESAVAASSFSSPPSPVEGLAGATPLVGLDGTPVAPAPESTAAPVVLSPPPYDPTVIHRPAATPAPRRRALRGFRLELMAGIADLQQVVSGCAVGETSFTLAVESVEGGVRILEASVESADASSPADVACAQALLRGRLIPAPSARPGRRWQLPFEVRSST